MITLKKKNIQLEAELFFITRIMIYKQDSLVF